LRGPAADLAGFVEQLPASDGILVELRLDVQQQVLAPEGLTEIRLELERAPDRLQRLRDPLPALRRRRVRVLIQLQPVIRREVVVRVRIVRVPARSVAESGKLVEGTQSMGLRKPGRAAWSAARRGSGMRTLSY
jgi:hypothetical protein